MSRIRGRDTKPEKAVRSLLHRMDYRFRLHRMDYRFRLHRRDLPGRPDIVLPKYRTAIFVHGCFWHRHTNCRFAYVPKSRRSFWEQKFKRNVERDAEAHDALVTAGWRILVIWECEIDNERQLERRLMSLLRRSGDRRV